MPFIRNCPASSEKSSFLYAGFYCIPGRSGSWISTVITHREKLLDFDWLRDCEFIRNLRANSSAEICNSF